MILQKTTLLAGAMLSFLTVSAQHTSLLYEVSGNDLQAPSYVFGTIHLLCSDDIQVTDAMKEKLTASQQLVLELDFDDPDLMQEMQQKTMLPDGKTIQDMMEAKDYAALSQFFQDSLKIPLTAVERFSPIALSSMLYMQMLPCQPGSYEASLTQLASAEGKEIIGLETIDEQMAAFNQIPEEGQIDYLTEMIEDYDKAQREFEQLVAAYQTQNVDELYEISQKSMEEVEGMEQYMLIDRNQKWVPQMRSLMNKQPTFFAVGAGHLGGDHGLIELLTEQGYTVTAVAP